MDFWATVMVLIRRWYITVPAFFATLGISAAVYSMVPLQYQSTSILVLTTPLTGGTAATNPAVPTSLTNPMLNFDHSLALSGSIVIQRMRTSEIADGLGVGPGGPTSYEISNGSSNPELLETGPFIFITATGPSPKTAQDLAQKVSARSAAVLARRQAELRAPATTHINLQTVVAPTAGQPLTGSPKRAAAAAGGLAGLSSLAAVFCVESLITHRRRRAERKRLAGQQPTRTISIDDVAGAGLLGGPADRSTQPANNHRVNGSSWAPSGSALDVIENARKSDSDAESEGP